MTNNAERRRNYNKLVSKKRIRRLKRMKARNRDPKTGVRLLRVRLAAPVIFTLSDQQPRTDLLRFIENIKKAVYSNKRVYVNFGPTRKMIADGTLFFWAELHRMNRRLGGKKRIGCSYPSDPIVEQVLQHIGILGMLNKASKVAIGHDTVKFWKRITDTVADGKLVSAVQDFGSPGEPKVLNYIGISEAMTNCVNHAYDSLDGTDARWWMFSEEKDGMRTIALCDLGSGIPTTLKENPDLDSILSGLRLGKHDAALIKAAFESGVSRSNLPNRGKGLHDVRKDLETHENGYLVVLSGCGFYGYSVKDNMERIGNFRESLPGTLITWKAPIKN